MNYKKIVTWLGKMAAAALLVSFLSIWTTGYIVTSYVEVLLKQFHIPLQVQPLTMNGVWGRLWGAEQAPESVLPATAPIETAEPDDSASSGTLPSADPSGSSAEDNPTEGQTDGDDGGNGGKSTSDTDAEAGGMNDAGPEAGTEGVNSTGSDSTGLDSKAWSGSDEDAGDSRGLDSSGRESSGRSDGPGSPTYSGTPSPETATDSGTDEAPTASPGGAPSAENSPSENTLEPTPDPDSEPGTSLPGKPQNI